MPPLLHSQITITVYYVWNFYNFMENVLFQNDKNVWIITFPKH